MNPKHFFAPGTVQHCRRPHFVYRWGQRVRRAASQLAPWLSLLVALGLVAISVALGSTLGTMWSPQ